MGTPLILSYTTKGRSALLSPHGKLQNLMPFVNFASSTSEEAVWSAENVSVSPDKSTPAYCAAVASEMVKALSLNGSTRQEAFNQCVLSSFLLRLSNKGAGDKFIGETCASLTPEKLIGARRYIMGAFIDIANDYFNDNRNSPILPPVYCGLSVYGSDGEAVMAKEFGEEGRDEGESDDEKGIENSLAEVSDAMYSLFSSRVSLTLATEVLRLLMESKEKDKQRAIEELFSGRAHELECLKTAFSDFISLMSAEDSSAARLKQQKMYNTRKQQIGPKSGEKSSCYVFPLTGEKMFIYPAQKRQAGETSEFAVEFCNESYSSNRRIPIDLPGFGDFSDEETSKRNLSSILALGTIEQVPSPAVSKSFEHCILRGGQTIALFSLLRSAVRGEIIFKVSDSSYSNKSVKEYVLKAKNNVWYHLGKNVQKGLFLRNLNNKDKTRLISSGRNNIIEKIKNINDQNTRAQRTLLLCQTILASTIFSDEGIDPDGFEKMNNEDLMWFQVGLLISEDGRKENIVSEQQNTDIED